MDFKIIFLISVITSKGKAEHEVLLEGYSRDINCKEDNVITIEDVKVYSPRCIYELDYCSEEQFMVVSSCNGKNICNLHMAKAIRSTCQNPLVRLEYDCFSYEPLWYRHQYECSNNNACRYTDYRIDINSSSNWIIECEKQQFNSMQNSFYCIRNYLFNKCLEKGGCSTWRIRRGSTSCCVTFPSVMTISFSCNNEPVVINGTFYTTPSSNSKSSIKNSASSQQHSAKINATHNAATIPDTDDVDVATLRGKTGIIIAVSVSLIISTVTVFVVVLYMRRSKRRQSYKHNENSVQFDNVESSSSIIHRGASLKADNTKHKKLSTNVSGEIIEKLSILPTSDSAYFVLDPNETGFTRTRNPDFDKLNEDKDGDHYATSVEGVYDEMNNRRHTENDDVNVYSHSVDDVYDVSAQDRQRQNDPTYNQFSGIDLENDYM